MYKGFIILAALMMPVPLVEYAGIAYVGDQLAVKINPAWLGCKGQEVPPLPAEVGLQIDADDLYCKCWDDGCEWLYDW